MEKYSVSVRIKWSSRCTFTSPSARAMLPVASISSSEGSATPLVVVAEHHGVRTALDGGCYHIFDIQTDTVGGALRSQTAARTRLRLSRLTSMARS